MLQNLIDLTTALMLNTNILDWQNMSNIVPTAIKFIVKNLTIRVVTFRSGLRGPNLLLFFSSVSQTVNKRLPDPPRCYSLTLNICAIAMLVQRHANWNVDLL